MMKNVFNHGLYLFFLSNNVSLGQTLLGPVVGGPGRAEIQELFILAEN